MKLKFIILWVLTAVLVSSFYLMPKKPEKKWCSCNNVSNIHKTARNGNFVTISWNAPSGGDPVQYYSYGGVSGGGTPFGGSTSSTQATIQDNNTGGTIQIRTHCKLGDVTCQSTGINGSWTPN